ncbi:MAG: D-alanyl-D-alanine carboxypeptidase [Caulobacter sp.]
MYQQPARRLSVSVLLAAALVVGPLMNTLAFAQVPYSQLPPSPPKPNPADQPKYAAVVVDANSGEVLYAKRADSPRYPASITKVMTLYLAFEALADGRMKTTDLITVSAKAASQPPTKLGVSAGDVITVEDAMKAITVKSANDMSVALAEHMAGSEEKFAALMTLRAQELGMSNTRFVNASGLPDSRQVSTARDIAILSRAVMRDFPQYYSLFNLRSFTYRGVTMNNHNRLLARMDGVDGLKTGYTNASGYNLAASGVRDGRRLIVVMLGGSSGAARDNHVQELLNTGFDVQRRRAGGERILVAQSLFEPPPPPVGVQYASIEQGGASSNVAFTAGPATDQVAVQRAMSGAAPGQKPATTKTAATKTKAPPKKPKGQWAVQAGAFKSKSQANTQLTTIRKRFGKVLDDAEGVIGDRVGGFFRVRFTGLSAEDAREACKALTAKRQTCMVIAPGR